MDIKDLKTQTNFAEMVNKPISRINLLIKLGKITTFDIDGRVFVVNNRANREACKRK